MARGVQASYFALLTQEISRPALTPAAILHVPLQPSKEQLLPCLLFLSIALGAR